METKLTLKQRRDRTEDRIELAKDSRKRASQRVTRLTKTLENLNMKIDKEAAAKAKRASKKPHTAPAPQAAVAAASAPDATPIPKAKRTRKPKETTTEETKTHAATA